MKSEKVIHDWFKLVYNSPFINRTHLWADMLVKVSFGRSCFNLYQKTIFHQAIDI
jgi:hypothetical protein